MKTILGAAACIAVEACLAQLPVVPRVSLPREVGFASNGVPVVAESVGAAKDGNDLLLVVRLKEAVRFSTDNIFKIPYGCAMVGLPPEVEREFQDAVNPLCSLTLPQAAGGGVSQAWNEDSADPLAARSLLVHRDSRKVVGAMSSRIFSDVSAADAFCRERLMPELMRLKAKVERRDAAHAVTGYLLQHPTGGEMHLEVRTAKVPNNDKIILVFRIGTSGVRP